MALPASGTISINSIRIELGVPSATGLTMSGLPNGSPVAINVWSASKPSTSAPFSLSQWYNYNHSATAPNIQSFAVIGTTDPQYGGFSASWSYVSGTSVNVTDTYLDYSFNSGSSWSQFTYLSGTSTTSITDSVEGLQGFTSLDNTYFRLRAFANGYQVPSSPLYAYPPFPY
jgi:hypothetical protein